MGNWGSGVELELWSSTMDVWFCKAWEKGRRRQGKWEKKLKIGLSVCIYNWGRNERIGNLRDHYEIYELGLKCKSQGNWERIREPKFSVGSRVFRFKAWLGRSTDLWTGSWLSGPVQTSSSRFSSNWTRFFTHLAQFLISQLIQTPIKFLININLIRIQLN